MPFKYYNEEPILSPKQILKPIAGWPKTIIVTWQNSFLKSAEAYNAKPVWSFSKQSREKVYEITYKEKKYSFAPIGIGGPNTASFMEEQAILGAKNFIFIGSCGALVNDAKHRIIIPDRAYRDEGTSWHYIPDTEEYIDIPTIDSTLNVVKNMVFDYEVGNVWTTDAVYRETPSAVKYYKDKGCVAVDMECASIMAAAKYLGVNAYQFFFTADSLASGSWKKGRLLHMAKTAWDAYLNLALELADSIS